MHVPRIHCLHNVMFTFFTLLINIIVHVTWPTHYRTQLGAYCMVLNFAMSYHVGRGSSAIFYVVRPQMWLTDHTLAPPQTQSYYHCVQSLSGMKMTPWAGVESWADCQTQ